MPALLPFITPFLLYIFNPVDFTDNGAQERYVHLLNCTVNRYIEMLEESNDIHLVNQTGQMDDHIHFLGLSFTSGAAVNESTARIMLLQLIDSFLDAINRDERLAPFLCPHPFTEDNIEIRVTFTNDCLYPYPQPGAIKYMIFSDGFLTFYEENPRLLGTFEKLREEPIEFSRLAENLPHQSPPRRVIIDHFKVPIF